MLAQTDLIYNGLITGNAFKCCFNSQLPDLFLAVVLCARRV